LLIFLIFIIFRHTYKNEVKYYIRTIPYLYVVGQTYPVAEVPGQNSRKVTSVIRGRLQVRLYKKKKKKIYTNIFIIEIIK